LRILVSNDDGIYADGIWALAGELTRIAEVIIVAPDREQSAVGTAVSLRKPLRVQEIKPLISGIKAYSVEGTPSDAVIVGLGKVVSGRVDLVVSGINQGSNLGEDVLISGTVGAALSGYLRGFPALAVSCEHTRFSRSYLEEVGRFAALLAGRIFSAGFPSAPFLNLNMPDLPMSMVKGIKITALAHRSHVNTVEEGHDGKRTYYTLVRASVNHQVEKRSDIGATGQGYITLTPLHLFLNDRIPSVKVEKLVDGLFQEFESEETGRSKTTK
jgi:5'-nucleotidase